MSSGPFCLSILAAAGLSACATYEPAPLEPIALLRQLESASSPLDGPDPPAAFGPRELAAFAVTSHPELTARRARLGVRSALLVEAGLLPDPQIGWGAMDLVASEIVDGTSSSLEVISGFGAMLPLLRPGEREARQGVAGWELEAERRDLLAAEWRLIRDVHVAYEEVRVAEAQLSQTRQLESVAESTRDYFDRARDAGTATAIQANLARGELLTIRLEMIRSEGRLKQARQGLHALLGVPPDLEIPLRDVDEAFRQAVLDETTPERLTEQAVRARPDLSALLARYQVAEESLKLAVAEQYPLVWIGTGLQITVPIFSGFARPKIRTALARREQVGRELKAAIHEARREIAETSARWRIAQREVALIDSELLANAEGTLELSREAFRVGEATLLESLALQRALLQARTARSEAIAERAKRAWELLAASGLLLPPPEESEGSPE